MSSMPNRHAESWDSVSHGGNSAKVTASEKRYARDTFDPGDHDVGKDKQNRHANPPEPSVPDRSLSPGFAVLHGEEEPDCGDDEVQHLVPETECGQEHTPGYQPRHEKQTEAVAPVVSHTARYWQYRVCYTADNRLFAAAVTPTTVQKLVDAVGVTTPLAGYSGGDHDIEVTGRKRLIPSKLVQRLPDDGPAARL